MNDNRKRRRQEPWKSADVKCPFYLRDDKHTIECEGFSEGLILTLSYRNMDGKNKHMGTFCAGPYSRCPICQDTMNIKYPD